MIATNNITKEEKTIVIGCDQSEKLTLLINGLKAIPDFFVNTISVSRISDLLSVAKTIHPCLLIFNFRNNQNAIEDFNRFVNKPEIPLLCFYNDYDFQTNLFNIKNIIFSYSIDSISNKGFFISTVRSIFLLKNQSTTSSEITSLANQAIEKDLTKTNRNMSRYVLELDQKIKVLDNVKERIKTLCPSVDNSTRMELLSIVNAIKTSVNNTKLWEDFKVYFEKTNPNFLCLLAKKHPQLTTKDLKYCCYLKMNMSNDDIRSLLDINQESVRTHKYRLKKKMQLKKELDLDSYLKAI